MNVDQDNDVITIGFHDEKYDYRGTCVRKPQFGETLKNGATVVDYRHVNDGEANWYPNGIVLARWERGRDEWVTWRAAYRPESNEWITEVGHYFQDILQAVTDFKER